MATATKPRSTRKSSSAKKTTARKSASRAKQNGGEMSVRESILTVLGKSRKALSSDEIDAAIRKARLRGDVHPHTLTVQLGNARRAKTVKQSKDGKYTLAK